MFQPNDPLELPGSGLLGSTPPPERTRFAPREDQHLHDLIELGSQREAEIKKEDAEIRESEVYAR